MKQTEAFGWLLLATGILVTALILTNAIFSKDWSSVLLVIAGSLAPTGVALLNKT